MSTDAHDKVTVTLPGIEPAAAEHRAVVGDILRIWPEDDWYTVLKRMCDTHGGAAGVARLAEQMGIKGMGRVYISRVLSSGNSRIENPSIHFIERVWQVAGRVYCPHLRHDISHADCQAHHKKTYAQVGVVRMGPLTTVDHWRACRQCGQNPNAEAEQAAISRHKGVRHA